MDNQSQPTRSFVFDDDGISSLGTPSVFEHSVDSMGRNIASSAAAKEISYFRGISDNASICALSMVCLNYNLVIAAYVMYILIRSDGVSPTEAAIFITLVLSGVVVGMVFFGFSGDVEGRKSSFRACIGLMVVGGVLSAFSGLFIGGLMVQLTLTRFMAMIGAGGLYPLVANMALNSKGSSQVQLANTSTVMIYGPLGGLGFVLGTLMVVIIGTSLSSADVAWRVLLATGLIPALYLGTYEVSDTLPDSWVKRKTEDALRGDNALMPSYRQDLCTHLSKSFYQDLGVLFGPSCRDLMFWTSLAWFFSDALCYGNFAMQAVIIRSVLENGSLEDDDTTVGATTVAVIGLGTSVAFWVGGIASVYAMKSTSVLGLQLQGLAQCSLLYVIITLCSGLLVMTDGNIILILTLYTSSYFAMGYGPAPATYLLPCIVFPADLRSTANGLSAAFGKIGAVLFVFFSMDYDIDITGLMAFLGVFSLFGGATTLVTVLVYRRAITNAQEKASGRQFFPSEQARERQLNLERDGASGITSHLSQQEREEDIQYYREQNENDPLIAP